MNLTFLESKGLIIIQGESKTYYFHLSDISSVCCERKYTNCEYIWTLIIDTVGYGKFSINYETREKAEDTAFQIMSNIKPKLDNIL